MSLIKNLATYPSRSNTSPSKTLASHVNTTSILMNTNTSNLMAAEALGQNVSKILTIKSSAFDYMVKNRSVASQRKTSAAGNAKVNTQTSNDSGGSVRLDLKTMKQQSNDSSSTISSTISVIVPETQNSRSKSTDIEELSNENRNVELNNGIDRTVTKEDKKIELSGKSEPYLTLSQEDYTEHKSAILQCKFSKDGKYVASVDSNSLIKSKLYVLLIQKNELFFIRVVN
jgi:hypothetical protein